MSVLKVVLVIVASLYLKAVEASRFRGRSPRCVKISNETAPLCQNLPTGYNEMMLPNLLDHDTINEVNKELGQWTPLVSSGCHPHLDVFLCSVFAPVCMLNQKTQIGPCQSLCSMVQASCEPLMRRHNYTWPEILNCSQYKQNEMCVNPPAPKKTRSVCVDDDENIIAPSFKKKFCAAQFAFRGRIVERKERKGIIILQFKISNKVSKLSKNLPKKSVVRLRVPVSNRFQCKDAQKRRPYLVFGKYKKGRKMVVTHLLKWKKKIKKIARRINKKYCRKY